MAIFPTDDPQYASVFAAEAAMVDASELIAAALERSGMSQAQLARALGVSRSEITARLQGERNITLRTLALTLHAMGERLHLASVVDHNASTQPHPVVPGDPFSNWKDPRADAADSQEQTQVREWLVQR